MSAKKSHVHIYRFLWHMLGPVIRAIYRFESDIVDMPAEPYLVLANHNLDLDAALVALSFPSHMYFVISEHALRKGFGSWMLRIFFAPIARTKGATDAQAALDVIRALRRGSNVCIFAEGNRSFSGVTGPIFPATGKLAKAAGATLVTYRISGGYLTKPRWSHARRKGKMRGTCINIYSPEQLKAMTAEEVNAHIAQDLFEDAFLRQQEKMIAFRGRKLAEGLENALFFCPKCDGIGTLKSEGDRFSCTCGLSLSYTEYGFFEGEDVPFSCMRDWDAWQRVRLKELTASKTLIFSDPDIRLYVINEKQRMCLADAGTLVMDAEALTLGGTCLLLADISGMAIVGSSRLLLSTNGQRYEIRAFGRYFCALKYFRLYQAYTKKENGL